MNEIMSDLKTLGYNGKFSEESLNDGNSHIDFIQATAWLSLQLSAVCNLDNKVTYLSDFEDLLGFGVEISCLLKELGCPHRAWITGNITKRLLSSLEKQHLIKYLVTELQAARILATKTAKPLKSIIEIEESSTALELKEMLMSLKFSKPPDSITPKKLFYQVEKRLKAFSDPLTPKEKVGKLLFSECLTKKQWFHLDILYKEMCQEYETRRKLLVTRLDVTVRSFLWNERLKNTINDTISDYDKRKAKLLAEPLVKISNILSAKSGLAVIDKTGSASEEDSAQSSVKKIIIDTVPDRGGRPGELLPPPPEVPSWQKNPPQSQLIVISKNSNSNHKYKHNNNYKRFDQRNYTARRNHRNDQQDRFYQPMNYCPQDPTQLEFGGYEPAGDNFRQYGMPENNLYPTNYNRYQPRREFDGMNNRSRGGSFFRGRYKRRGHFN